MSNNWKIIWEKREFEEPPSGEDDFLKMFIELKRCNGFDSMGGMLSVSALMKQYENTKNLLTQNSSSELNSIFEIGCGSGANLYMFERDGFVCGGIDYSHALVDIAKRVLKTKDLTCDEAVNCNTEKKYDCMLSNSVFSYFDSVEYAKEVLEKMYRKTNYSIGLIDIHDIEKKDDYIAYRTATVENYKERYANLPRLFYGREFFSDFAKKHNMDIVFCKSDVEGYWNNNFVFNCFMYKKDI